MAHRCFKCNKKIDINAEYCIYCGEANAAKANRYDSDGTITILPEDMVAYRRRSGGLFGDRDEEYTDFAETDYRFINPNLKIVDSQKIVILSYEETEKKMKYLSIGFAARFKELRQKEGHTQKDSSEIFCIKQSTVSSWETGASLPTLEKAIEMAKYFRVSLDYLTGLSNALI